VWSCSCWHNSCTLHKRSANWWRIEVPVLFKVAGHYRGGRLLSSTPRVGSLFLKTSWHRELRWNSCLVVSRPGFWQYTSELRLERKTRTSKILLCLSIKLHLTKNIPGGKMLCTKSDFQVTGKIHIGHQLCFFLFFCVLFFKKDFLSLHIGFQLHRHHLFNKKFKSVKTRWVVTEMWMGQTFFSEVMAVTDLWLHCTGVWGE